MTGWSTRAGASNGARHTRRHFRDFFEHLDDYLVAGERRHKRLPGRVSPVLHCRWDCSNVVVRFGEDRMDVTLAAQAAVDLAEVTSAVWEQQLEASRESRAPPPDDGIPRMLVIRQSISTVIGGPDDLPEVMTGVLQDVHVREMTSDELATAVGDS